MIRLATQLAWRFRSSKQKSGFTSFISASSTIGIGLGCFVLIVLLSVMNGFERELKSRILSVVPHGELWAVDGRGIQNWPELIEQFKQDTRVVQAEPYIKATGMLQFSTQMKAIEVLGLSPQYSSGTALTTLVPEQYWQAFSANAKSILLGDGVMNKLDLKLGDRVQLLLPQVSENLSLKPPKTMWLEVAGRVKIGGELDNHLALVNLSALSEVMGVEEGAQGVRLRYVDPFIASSTTRELGYNLQQHLYMSDWTRTQGHLYQDIQLVRAVVYLALTLVIAVACFNIVSTLVMSVNEKQSEIAMLKSMGARDRLIMFVFIIQGLINGFIGTAIGVALGVAVALNLSDIAMFIEAVTGTAFLSGDIYFIDFLPSELYWSEVIITASIAIVLSVLSTVYPAKKASTVDPASALSH